MQQVGGYTTDVTTVSMVTAFFRSSSNTLASVVSTSASSSRNNSTSSNGSIRMISAAVKMSRQQHPGGSTVRCGGQYWMAYQGQRMTGRRLVMTQKVSSFRCNYLRFRRLQPPHRICERRLFFMIPSLDPRCGLGMVAPPCMLALVRAPCATGEPRRPS